MAKLNNTLTAERLREVLDYDIETGIFTWRITRSGCAKAGRVAGHTSANGRVSIEINERAYEASQLAWLHVYGEFPPKKLTRINGIHSDNRIANFHDPDKPVPRKTHPPLTFERVREFLGRYPSPEEAHSAYIEAKKRLHPGFI